MAESLFACVSFTFLKDSPAAQSVCVIACPYVCMLTFSKDFPVAQNACVIACPYVCMLTFFRDFLKKETRLVMLPFGGQVLWKK